uniref:Uncharacterized protein n=1 Tax=Meloidogyne floridensis TaxID=298350 RepID=A0A915PBN5_9BILA
MKKIFFIYIYLFLLINGQEIFKENNYNLNPSFILDEPPQNIISNKIRPYRRFILDEKPSRFAQQNYGTEMANWRKEIKKNQNNNLQFNNNLLGNNLLFRKVCNIYKEQSIGERRQNSTILDPFHQSY